MCRLNGTINAKGLSLISLPEGKPQDDSLSAALPVMFVVFESSSEPRLLSLSVSSEPL